MSDLIIELGCEELPAASVEPMAQHLGAVLKAALQASDLCAGEPEIFATPRRIAARFTQVGERQPDTEVERRGPAKAAAFKDDKPTKALEGFMRSAGVTLEQLATIETPKGEWVVARQTQPGKSLTEVLLETLPEAIKTMPMPRRMRWGASPQEFLRPVVWLLAMHGESVLPLEVLGLKAGNQTLGHRFHAPDAITLASPSNYESALETAYVMADSVKRRARIVEQVKSVAATIGGTPVMDDELVDEVNALVEWPVALAGRFEANFLEIPKEALIQTMQENQRYFALLDDQGALMPAFITIANLESNDPETVVDGNERVIRPRFADTMFFWSQDKKQPLAAHQPQLSRLMFQEKLGSVADKVLRMEKLGGWLASELLMEAADVKLAVTLCKCDLNTEIVKELPKMQGICGRYYATRDGHPASVCEAMEQHYFPNKAGGPLPEGVVSQLVSLADKTDTLAGIFGLGMKPTGAKDPFGLRRASLGIVRILVEQKLDLDLNEILQQALDNYGERLQAPDREAMLAYVIERMRGYLVDKGYAADAIDAVLAKGLTRPLDIVARLEAMQQFRSSDAAASLAAASKRIGNILKKVETAVPDEVNKALLHEPAEAALYAEVDRVKPVITQHMQGRDYQASMRETASLRETVDAFFDGVMVMDENVELRDNRLALLRQVNELCCSTAELSLLQPAEVETATASSGQS
ncbi:glycine--tRNA ligase subunit beta [Granulosicoccus antarcticus]|uniref:Glycine--tRNA ligase beta subunit n=1 Tax=Granulosicoccus antarcticus IMCC3135 TaxID=1192854 RepID=A0A2Z2NIC7_9GAMM|nr:glycine--tRNA ligase subunit beta [Granulosicoccus antarcticus]ASJ71092.1 Glycine--tRNA ligase beta subunit [Granulosicoccus antarcticus IMCC3135]